MSFILSFTSVFLLRLMRLVLMFECSAASKCVLLRITVQRTKRLKMMLACNRFWTLLSSWVRCLGVLIRRHGCVRFCGGWVGG